MRTSSAGHHFLLTGMIDVYASPTRLDVLMAWEKFNINLEIVSYFSPFFKAKNLTLKPDNLSQQRQNMEITHEVCV